MSGTLNGIKIFKYVRGADVSEYGAFPLSESLTFKIRMPRSFASAAPVLRIAPDGGTDRDVRFTFSDGDGAYDTFEASIEPSELLGNADGLLYYTFVFPNGEDTLFASSVNNVDFELVRNSEYRFRLLIYREDYTTPEWVRGATMYHIFVDRFCRGDGEVGYRRDAVIDGDWNEGIPQYAEYPGADVSNNVFFGGNLWGVAEKLDYLKSLNVNVIYLSPVFEAASNHKYDTGDYLRVDGGFGGDTAFEHLLKKAGEKGIRVILDGVFNHTGDDSRYFDRYGNYGGGAYGDPESPYRDWYRFKSGGEEYECWWGIRILPKLDHGNADCRSFFTSRDGIGASYVKKGISGWRLDVADELSDEFLDEFRRSVKEASGDRALIIGEVWENAADKVAYGARRRYLRGLQLDSVMNYPLRNGIIAFVGEEGNAEALYDVLTEIYGSYPRRTCDSLMNIIGTHDTERILTVLGGDPGDGCSNRELSLKRMTADQHARAVRLLKIASAIQYTVFGFPSVYYGDEAGMEGYRDPFCRRPFPWGREDKALLAHYRLLGEIRSRHQAFAGGHFSILEHGEHYIAYERTAPDDRVVVVAARNYPIELALDGRWRDALTGKAFCDRVAIDADSVLILEEDT